MKQFQVLLLGQLLVLTSCTDKPAQIKQECIPTKQQSLITVTPFHDSLGWCYDIYKDSVLYIHQPTVPAIQGKHGFHSKADAYKAASLAVEKIQQGIAPPALSVDEMRKSGIWLKNYSSK